MSLNRFPNKIAGKDLVFTTFGQREVQGMGNFHKTLVENNVTVGTLYQYLRENIDHPPKNFFKQLLQDLGCTTRKNVNKPKVQ